MKFRCRSEVWKAIFSREVNRSGRKALSRAAAYVRGVARRKIRKRAGSSPPGVPPHEHRSFRNTIVFAVDPFGSSAYVGPRMTSGRRNSAGRPVPNVLEFGGRSGVSRNRAWWVGSSRIANLRSIRNRAGVVTYLRRAGFGPFFIGSSVSAVVSAASRGTRRGNRRNGRGSDWRSKIRKRYSPVLGRRVYVLALPLKSDRMVERAADNVISCFGYPMVPESEIAPRPFMGPTLRDSQSRIAEFFRNIIQ